MRKERIFPSEKKSNNKLLIPTTNT